MRPRVSVPFHTLSMQSTELLIPLPTRERPLHTCMFCGVILRGGGTYDTRLCLLDERTNRADWGHCCRECGDLWPDGLGELIVLRQNHLARLRLRDEYPDGPWGAPAGAPWEGAPFDDAR